MYPPGILPLAPSAYRHLFCAMCLLSWWHASDVTSCPTCRWVSAQVPVRDHSHETLIEAVRAKSGEDAEPESFNPRVFEEFFGMGEVVGMDVEDTDSQSAGDEQPYESIDLTGDDD
ncbi:hypothetical protein BJ322DRAFT_1103526 [Thelephora terrestris]|uniref:RING-type domain-containing protein n=1 Tax=Thelephora terrestris TaxID=56493 RepID=A0A9P6HRA7_9AGAM|nr:hypothetical protein BJ322DRAFT_1103526 [Thelephora terrestris]